MCYPFESLCADTLVRIVGVNTSDERLPLKINIFFLVPEKSSPKKDNLVKRGWKGCTKATFVSALSNFCQPKARC